MSDKGVVLLLPSVEKPNRQLHEEHLGVDLVHDEVWLGLWLDDDRLMLESWE